MPPKSRRGGAAAARKAPATRRVGRVQASAEEALPAEEVKEAPAEERVVEEPKRQPSPPTSQQQAVEEKGSDATANGSNHAEGIVFCQ
jgi:hypothetical protein